jgi:hypothetical protein
MENKAYSKLDTRTIKNLKFILNKEAKSEQYYVYDKKGNLSGYVSTTRCFVYCHYPRHYERTIYCTTIKGKGYEFYDGKERHKILSSIAHRVQKEKTFEKISDIVLKLKIRFYNYIRRW